MKNVIYKISNSINKKIYIGSAKFFNKRKSVHICYLKKGKHHSPILQNHVYKYGIECLIFDIIEFCENENDIIEREQYYIDTLKPEFNVLKTANSRLNIKHTKESIDKMVQTRRERGSYKKGYKRPKSVIKKMVESRKGYKHSEETKEKIRLSLKNRVLSESALENIRRAAKRRKGVKISDDHRKKISIARKYGNNYMRGRKGNLHHNFGKKTIDDTRRKMSERSKKVIDESTGIIYKNIKDCCNDLNIPYGTMSKYVIGMVKSVTKFKYYESK